ncbi:MAG: hypothetical protein JSS12_09145 [Verrucomicrobia bacterium]|nr:hypothetical protein [Verrucomicrobiota bacterium]
MNVNSHMQNVADSMVFTGDRTEQTQKKSALGRIVQQYVNNPDGLTGVEKRICDIMLNVSPGNQKTTAQQIDKELQNLVKNSSRGAFQKIIDSEGLSPAGMARYNNFTDAQKKHIDELREMRQYDVLSALAGNKHIAFNADGSLHAIDE